ncbi:MAG: hypothetical protein ACUVQQ_05185 [Thermogutta sp.]
MSEQSRTNAPAERDAEALAGIGPEDFRRMFTRRGEFAGLLRAMWSGVLRRPDVAAKLADTVKPGPQPAEAEHVRRWAARWDIALSDDRCQTFLAVCETTFALWVKWAVWCLAACRLEGSGRVLPDDAWGRLAEASELAAWDGPRGDDPCAEAVGWAAPLFAILDPEGWFWGYREVWDESLAVAAGRCLERLRAVAERHARAPARSILCDWWRPAFEACFPKALRLAQGEFYTPPWLAEHVLREAGYPDRPGATLLDPSCGSGAFLTAALRLTAGQSPGSGLSAVRRLLAERTLRGIDCRPLAVLMARANYVTAAAAAWTAEPDNGPAGDCPRMEAVWRPPVYRADLWDLAAADLTAPAGEGGPTSNPLPADFIPPGGFDFIVGNPPWLMWDRLEDARRRHLLPILEGLGGLELTAREFRHGAAKRDLSGVVVRFCAEGPAAENGCVAMVVPISLWGNPATGRGFRRWASAEPHRLRVVALDDLSAASVFSGTNQRTAVVYVTKGGDGVAATPVLRYRRWLPAANGTTADGGTRRGRRLTSSAGFRVESGSLPLSEAAEQPPVGAVLPPEIAEIFRRLTGKCEYTAYLGGNTGGANGIYWLQVQARDGRTAWVENLPERGRLRVPRCRARMEAELLFPLLRWRDVREYAATPGLYLLMVQDLARRTGLPEEVLAADYPLAYEYLRQFEALLRGRAAYRKLQSRGPWYSLYNIGRYTFAPYKAVWRRMDRRVRAAAVGPMDDPLLGPRPVIPQESCAFIPADSEEEARYLAVLLNGPAARLLSAVQMCRGGKGFGSPGMIRTWRLPRYRPDDPRHRKAAQAYPSGSAATRSVDYAGGAVLGLTRREVDLLADFLTEGEG